MSTNPTSPHKPQILPRTPPSKEKDDPSKPRQAAYSRTPAATGPNPQSSTPLPFHNKEDLDLTLDPNSPLHFSPSKARAAAQQSQQLAVLKRWLVAVLDPNQNSLLSNTLISKWESEYRLLSTSNPELAAESLRWLQEVMYVNRAADERGRLVFEAQKEEVSRLEQARELEREGASSTVVELLQMMYASLTDRGRDAADSLAETIVMLGRVPQLGSLVPLDREFAQEVLEYTVHSQETQIQVETLQSLHQQLSKQLEWVQTQLARFEDDRRVAAAEAEQMHPQTAQWNRETKQIAMKIKEYTDRAATLQRSRPGSEGHRSKNEAFVGIEDVIEMQERVEKRKKNVRKLEESLRSMNGLPPDLEASRQEVKRSKIELERLKARREELFGMIAGK